MLRRIFTLCWLIFAAGCVSGASAQADEHSPAPATPLPIRFLLTFDDGPSASRDFNTTELILDTLAKNNIQPGIKAIFFVQTRAVNGGGTELGKIIMRREWEEGHLLGFHSATPHHTNHRNLNDRELQTALENGIADLTDITGTAPQLVRPPFWSYDDRTLAAYQKNNLNMLLTDLTARDGKIWGINFSFTKHHTMYNQLEKLRDQWLKGELPTVNGCVPIVVTFHDVNGYTANHIEDYLQILVDVAAELTMTTTAEPFYNNRDDIERAALAKVTTPNLSSR